MESTHEQRAAMVALKMLHQAKQDQANQNTMETEIIEYRGDQLEVGGVYSEPCQQPTYELETIQDMQGNDITKDYSVEEVREMQQITADQINDSYKP